MQICAKFDSVSATLPLASDCGMQPHDIAIVRQLFIAHNVQLMLHNEAGTNLSLLSPSLSVIGHMTQHYDH